ncbi:unnamed protein product [Enterobius vermicularis]|uniref:VHS domain-containing protein n=1 Tax=Enterobius vermicularis TaxID=51028 RepID=A0A158QA70_ENTVE|nr:unnamed protein product [Enterobius vermicularis]
MSANIEGKTLEYFITRATDPFTAEIDRVKYVDQLCKGICKEVDGPKNAFRLLAYKVLSPSQTEVLNTLKAIDACVTRCGSVVHDELVKSDLLEHIVKILSPKFSGDGINEEIRDYAVNMITQWHNSFSHISAVKETYKKLKLSGLIPEERFMSRKPGSESPSQSRHAYFNDEEKTRLLSKLLKSKNPKDLQAANRLIRSLEEQKLEEASKRREDIEKAKSSCYLLMEMMNSLNFRCSSNSENDAAKELYATLLNLRPLLFRYACMAADGDDNTLPEILTVNDGVNRAIELYKMSKLVLWYQANCTWKSAEEVCDWLDHICHGAERSFPIKPTSASLEEKKLNLASQKKSMEPGNSFFNPNFIHAEASTSTAVPLKQDDEPLILVGTSEENIVNDSKCDRDAIDALTLLIEADIFPPDNKTKQLFSKKVDESDKGSDRKNDDSVPELQASLDLLDPFVSKTEPSESEIATTVLQNILCDFSDIHIGNGN